MQFELLSAETEKLLKTIIEKKNQGESDYWEKTFEALSEEDDVVIRSQFRELKNRGMIDIFWADNCPAEITLLNDGKFYFQEKEHFLREKNKERRVQWVQALLSGVVGAVITVIVEKIIGII